MSLIMQQYFEIMDCFDQNFYLLTNRKFSKESRNENNNTKSIKRTVFG